MSRSETRRARLVDRFARNAQQAKPGILIADDEPLVRDLLQAVLQHQGFTVWLAASGHDALQLYQQNRPQIALVLLDVRMPGLDGPQTLARLQRLNPAVACCFMTGYAGDYTEVDLLQQGAARVFAKPFELGELHSFLGQLASKRSNRGEW